MEYERIIIQLYAAEELLLEIKQSALLTWEKVKSLIHEWFFGLKITLFPSFTSSHYYSGFTEP